MGSPSEPEQNTTERLSSAGSAQVRLLSTQPHGLTRRIASAAGLSALLHVVIIAILVAPWVSVPRGGDGQRLGDMIVEIVDATAVDSVATAAKANAGGEGALAETEGLSPLPSQPVTSSAARPEIKSAANGLPPVDGAQSDAPSSLKPDRVLHDERADGSAHEPPRDRVNAVAATAVAALPTTITGGATSVAMTETSEQASAAAASPGTVERYRNDVRQALGRQPPKRGLGAGTARTASVVIAFDVTDHGKVAHVELLEASRNIALNNLLVSWISTATLPPPPPQLTAADRRFSLPLTIR